MKIFNTILLSFFVMMGASLHAAEAEPLPRMEVRRMQELFGTAFTNNFRDVTKTLGIIRQGGQGSLSIMANDVGVLDLTVPLFHPFSNMIQLYFTLFGLLQNDDTFEGLVRALNRVFSLGNNVPDAAAARISSWGQAESEDAGEDAEGITIKRLSPMNALKFSVGDRAHKDLKENKYSGIDKDRVGLLEKYFYDVKLSFDGEVRVPITKNHLINLKKEMQRLESRAYSLRAAIGTTVDIGTKVAVAAGAGALAWGVYNHGTENVMERMVDPALKFVQSFLPTATTLTNWGFYNAPSFLTFSIK